jgi:alkylhydroperoxidase family enzyme
MTERDSDIEFDFFDEPETEEERAAVAEAWDAIRRGDVVSDEDLRRQLGL